MKALILSTEGFGNGSMYPFIHYKDDLEARFGFTSEEIVSNDLKEKIRAIKKFDGDLLFINTPHRLAREATEDFYIEVNKIKGNAKVVHFDYGDGHQSMQFESVPYVDLFLKQYINRDMSDYEKKYIGGSQITDYFVKNGLEESITNEIWTNMFQSQILPEDYHKLLVGWNFGLWKRLIYLAEGRESFVLWAKDKKHKRIFSLMRTVRDDILRKINKVDKPIDVYCRAALYKGWTKMHREKAIAVCNDLPSTYNVVSSIKKVGFSDYYREMRNSRIFVSPSGWCEYTPKDYEAMYFGALLIKPCVEHIDTVPDILIPDETYVSVKWDLSDLKEKCIYYLEHEDERLKIVENARKAFVNYYESKMFLDKIEEILSKLDLLESK